MTHSISFAFGLVPQFIVRFTEVLEDASMNRCMLSITTLSLAAVSSSALRQAIHSDAYSHLWPAWPHQRDQAQRGPTPHLRPRPPLRVLLRRKRPAAPAARHFVDCLPPLHGRWWMASRCWSRCWPPLCSACPGIGEYCMGAGWAATGGGRPADCRRLCRKPSQSLAAGDARAEVVNDRGGARNLQSDREAAGGVDKMVTGSY